MRSVHRPSHFINGGPDVSGPYKAHVIAARRASPGVTLVEMLIVMTIIGLMAAISFPALSSGLESLRLASATDSIVSFLNGGLNRAQRRQEAVEVAVSAKENFLSLTSASLSRRLEMPSGVTIQQVWPKLAEETDAPRLFLLLPGGAVPRIGIEIANRKGVHRIVRVNPMTGVPEVERIVAGQEPGQ
ncbi:MAG TPA: prepilin-type N-terminal cleavage/methylation domain-containing protein [Bryobacteraceae bacterium]|nr:prepilin-type N-terminal cleavage/methylation domain-containing protein [Bryobacteraceae bacterium]